MAMRAVRDGDDYVLSGTKVWITNGGISDLYTVFAKTDPAAGHRGISVFVVEKDWGVQVAKLEHKLGVQGLAHGPDRARRGAGAGREPDRRGGSGASTTPCTRWTAAGPPSARRPSASRKVRWTTPSGT